MNPPSGSTGEPVPAIISTRVIAAPRERVFAAFADPALVARWFGPKGFTNTIHSYDFRPGGQWRVTMHAPGGADFENLWEFREIVAPERIAMRHLETMHVFDLTVTLAERDDGTELTWRMVFGKREEYDKMKDFVAQANDQNLERLAAVLGA